MTPSLEQSDFPHDWDAMLSSAIQRSKEWDEPVSKRRLVRLIMETQDCERSEALAVVQDYCLRHGVPLEEPRPPAWRMAVGCVLALLLPVIFLAILFGIIAGIPPRVSSATEPIWLILIKYGWAVFLTFLLVYELRGRRLRRSLFVLKQIRPVMVIQNIVILIITIGFALILVRLFPFLDRSWLYLLPGSNGHTANINLLPAQIKYFGPFFLVLLALNLPTLARSEEQKYRQGTRNWREALPRSVHFGLIHCLVGIPIYAGLALTVAGLWFTFQYFQGGIERSTLHHTVYNVSAVSAVFVLLLVHQI